MNGATPALISAPLRMRVAAEGARALEPERFGDAETFILHRAREPEPQIATPD